MHVESVLMMTKILYDRNVDSTKLQNAIGNYCSFVLNPCSSSLLVIMLITIPGRSLYTFPPMNENDLAYSVLIFGSLGYTFIIFGFLSMAYDSKKDVRHNITVVQELIFIRICRHFQ